MRGQFRTPKGEHESGFAKVSGLSADPDLVELLASRNSRRKTIAPSYKEIEKGTSDTAIYLRQQRANEIAKVHRINHLAAEILASRGFAPGPETARYLSAKDRALPKGSAIMGVSEAASIVAADIRAGRLVAFAGDYDVDGVTALAQVSRMMSVLGARFTVDSPCRLTEGYGLSERLVRKAYASGAATLVCLDFGSSNHEAIRLAQSLGMKVIVIDHHLGEELATLPAEVLVNPHQPGCGFEDGRLCASALTYFWLGELASRFGIDNTEDLLPLAGFATIADVVPQVELNRAITARALELTYRSESVGIKALLETLKSRGVGIETQDVAYKIAPILNAAGRMLENGAQVALRLLTTDDVEEAETLAERCFAANSERKRLESEMMIEVAARVEQFHSLPTILVLESDKFHPGVMGLVAARTVERYGRPTLLFCKKSDGVLTGSGRSLPGFPLKSLLDECASSLLRYGGHAYAVGCTLKEDEFANFQWRINYYAESQGELPAHEAKYDRELSLRAYAKAQEQIIDQLKVLAPTGKDNEPATFLAKNLSLVSAYQIGKRHTLLILREGKKRPTLVAGYLWHNPDHPAAISTEGDVSFSPGHPFRLPIHRGAKVNIVYRPMRFEGRDITTGETSAKIEIVALTKA